jgi:uncharacterized membrane protein
MGENAWGLVFVISRRPQYIVAVRFACFDTGRLHMGISAMRKTATRFLDSLCGIGLLLGGLAFAGSLVPTLVPRDALVQGVMSGVCFALGYGIGVLLSLLLGRWRPVSLRPLLKAVYGFALVVCTIIMLYAVWQAPHWQNRLRALMQLPALDATWVWAVLAISVSVFTVLLLISQCLAGQRGIDGVLGVSAGKPGLVSWAHAEFGHQL